MPWSFFCAATHNIFIKLLARPDCTVDKAIQLLASPFGSNAHKAGGIAILASLLARPDCTVDKAIKLLASPFGSNAHKEGGIAILASLLARPDCTFELAVQLLSSAYGSNAHKEHGKAALASMLSQLAALDIKDSFVIVTELLTSKIGSLHPNVQSFIQQSLRACSKVQETKRRREVVNYIVKLTRSDFRKAHKTSRGFVTVLVRCVERFICDGVTATLTNLKQQIESF